MARRKAQNTSPTSPESATEDEDLFKKLRMPSPETSALGEMTEEQFARAQGWTPLEFLTHTYRNPWQKMEHRISAAKTVMDFVHRKLPARVEVSGGAELTMKQLDIAALSKLSEEELKVLEEILEKAEIR